MTVRLCLWSGPRNVSTALMYSFAQRPDTRVLDEPLYAHYLRVTGIHHPGRDEILAALDPDGDRVVREVVLGPCDRPISFQKHMAHHLVELDLGFLASTTNVLLIRDPRQVLLSYARTRPDPTIEDVGIARQSALVRELTALGQDPAVLDSRLLLDDPRGVLERLCEHVGIPFDPAMLAWEPGPRPEDGVWARHWYAELHRSAGFAPRRVREEPLPPRLEPLLERCRPHYEELVARAARFARHGSR